MSASSYIMLISHDGKTIEVEMVENQATTQLKALLETKEIKVTLHPYGGFELVGELPQRLKTEERRINT